MNSITLMGRLARDPDVRQVQTQKGTMNVAGFPLVVKRNKTNKAFVVMISAFGTNADFVQKYLVKGTKIMLTGELVNTPYKDEQTGKTYYYSEVIMDMVEFGESKRSQETNEENSGFMPDTGNQNPFEIPQAMIDEMPFR